MPAVATAPVASLTRIASLTPPTLHRAGLSSTHDVATPASCGSSVKLTPPPAETPGSGSFRRTRRPSCSSEEVGSATLALPEDLLAEERRKHARTRELLETQTTQLAARERQILLLRAELKEAKARPDRRRAHKQPPPPPPAKQGPVRWSWSVSLWPWLGSHQPPRARSRATQAWRRLQSLRHGPSSRRRLSVRVVVHGLGRAIERVGRLLCARDSVSTTIVR